MAGDLDEMGSIKAYLTDARERIKESESRCFAKIDEAERRLTDAIRELETKFNEFNNKFVEWLPLLTNLKSIEETKKNMNLLLIVAFISTIASWMLTIFIYFIKKGGSL